MRVHGVGEQLDLLGRVLCGARLKLMRVDDEPSVLGNLVVQCTAGLVAHIRLPVDSTASSRARGFVYRINEPTADASTPRGFGSEQVL